MSTRARSGDLDSSLICTPQSRRFEDRTGLAGIETHHVCSRPGLCQRVQDLLEDVTLRPGDDRRRAWLEKRADALPSPGGAHTSRPVSFAPEPTWSGSLLVVCCTETSSNPSSSMRSM